MLIGLQVWVIPSRKHNRFGVESEGRHKLGSIPPDYRGITLSMSLFIYISITLLIYYYV